MRYNQITKCYVIKCRRCHRTSEYRTLPSAQDNSIFCVQCRHGYTIYYNKRKRLYFTLCCTCGKPKYSKSTNEARIKFKFSCYRCAAKARAPKQTIYDRKYLVSHGITQNREGKYVISCPKNHQSIIKSIQGAVKISSGEHRCAACESLRRAKKNKKLYPPLKNEIWKPIKGFENYAISSLGRVRNKEYKILRPQTVSQGKYKAVFLYSPLRKAKLNYISRLVAEHFIKNPKQLPEANHKDFCKENNTKRNLEWISHKRNLQSAIQGGIRKRMWNKDIKLNPSLIKQIRAHPELSTAYWAKKLGVSWSCIYSVRINKNWKHVR